MRQSVTLVLCLIGFILRQKKKKKSQPNEQQQKKNVGKSKQGYYPQCAGGKLRHTKANRISGGHTSCWIVKLTQNSLRYSKVSPLSQYH